MNDFLMFFLTGPGLLLVFLIVTVIPVIVIAYFVIKKAVRKAILETDEIITLRKRRSRPEYRDDQLTSEQEFETKL